MKKLASILSLVLLSTPLLAETKVLLNVDKNGLAIQGYDPVAFFTNSKPVKGKKEFTTQHHGAVYHFSSGENKARFDQEPARYEPEFGGFCAFGVSRNKLVEIDPEAFQVMNGRLLLQYSKSVRNEFNKNPQENLAKASTNWASLVETKGK